MQVNNAIATYFAYQGCTIFATLLIFLIVSIPNIASAIADGSTHIGFRHSWQYIQIEDRNHAIATVYVCYSVGIATSLFIGSTVPAIWQLFRADSNGLLDGSHLLWLNIKSIFTNDAIAALYVYDKLQSMSSSIASNHSVVPNNLLYNSQLLVVLSLIESFNSLSSCCHIDGLTSGNAKLSTQDIHKLLLCQSSRSDNLFSHIGVNPC